MDRAQAMDLLKEIAFKIPELGPQAMSILENEPTIPDKQVAQYNSKDYPLIALNK